MAIFLVCFLIWLSLKQYTNHLHHYIVSDKLLVNFISMQLHGKFIQPLKCIYQSPTPSGNRLIPGEQSSSPHRVLVDIKQTNHQSHGLLLSS